MRRLTPHALLLAACLVLAGCGGGDAVDVAPQAAPTPTPSCLPAPPTGAAPAGAAADVKTKPQIEIPDTPPPCGLQITDIVVGTGRAAKAGQQVSMQYVGVTYADGKEFDASWDRGEPFTFGLGGGQVIPGWDQGIVGMKVGGRRQLVIPAELGYGEQGTPDGAIPGGATLVFVVDLVSIA